MGFSKDFVADPPRKPPDPGNKKRLLLLALQVALNISSQIPVVTLNEDRKLRSDLHRYAPGGLLCTARLTDLQKERVLNALQALPSQLVTKGDVCPLIADTGCSRSVTGFKQDFVPGTLKSLNKPVMLDGISGSLSANQHGLARFEVFDDDGKICVLEQTMLYMPELKCRLWSPQFYFEAMSKNGGGEELSGGQEPHLSTYWNRSVLHLPKHTITMPHHHATRLPIIPGFKDALSTCKTLAMSSVTDEINQNLSTLQKMLLQWHH